MNHQERDEKVTGFILLMAGILLLSTIVSQFVSYIQ